MKIEEIKAAAGVAMSERLFEMSDPIPYQCGKIDKVIEAIRSIEKSITETEKELRHVEGAEDAVGSNANAEYHTWGLVDKVEDIRKALEGVRAWGQVWKDLAKRLAEQTNDYALCRELSSDLNGLHKLFPQFYENENA